MVHCITYVGTNMDFFADAPPPSLEGRGQLIKLHHVPSCISYFYINLIDDLLTTNIFYKIGICRW